LNLDVCPFNLDVTLCCGQVFRWNKKGEWWYGVVNDRVFKLRQAGKELEFANVDAGFITRYFSLDHDLHRISKAIGKDDGINAALREFWGLRIARQEPWECLISFICATYKSVTAIKQMLHKLSAKFGEKLTYDGYDFYSFPKPEKLARASLDGLAACGLGYRGKYVLETSRRVFSGDFDLEGLGGLRYQEARGKLCELPGVGLKVADCVLLFSLGRLDAFPVDVWVKRIILRHYADYFSGDFVEKLLGRKSFSSSDYVRLNGFGRKYFGEFAGYAQEYMYHYERFNRKIEKGCLRNTPSRRSADHEA
jgi:N-glycosylase/DNA lyase